MERQHLAGKDCVSNLTVVAKFQVKYDQVARKRESVNFLSFISSWILNKLELHRHTMFASKMLAFQI